MQARLKPIAATAATLAAAILLTACANALRPACPTAEQMEQPELIGLWKVQMEGVVGPISMQLGPHPEWDGTVKGSITRPEFKSIVVGDVNKGIVTMEESRDGKKVSGNWGGDVVQGSCAREIRGDFSDSDDITHKFVMRKSSQ